MIKEEKRQISSLVFEGMTSIRAIIDNLKSNVPNARKIDKILYDKSRYDKIKKDILYLEKMSEIYSFGVLESTTEEIDSLTIGNSHGGIIAICHEREYKTLELGDIKENGFYVMIEGIEDPYNFGYALRSVYAAGAQGIILSKRNWLSAAGVVCRSSAGASERIPIFIADDNFISLFKEKKYKVVCADIKNSKSIYEVDLKYPVFLIVGGEKRGISSSILKSADEIVRIDYANDFKLSLSAASASTIIAFEIMRQNMK